MTTYTYRAKNELGEVVTGTVEAGNDQAAEQVISQHQLIPLSISEQVDFGKTILGFGGISTKEKALFTRSLAALLEAGLPLVQSLSVVEEQVRNKRLKLITTNIVHDIEGGITLSKSIEKYPSVFSGIYINMVRSGEATGRLDKVMRDLADQLESDAEFVARIRGAMYYPIFIIAAMFIVGLIVMVKIIPQLTEVFKDANVPLPFMTQVLIALSSFLQRAWYLVVVGVVVLLGLFRASMETDIGQRLYNRLALSVPPFKTTAYGVAMTRFTRVMGMLLQSGVPILDALTIVSEVTGNLLIRDAIERARSEVERGVPLSSSLSREAYFPTLVTQMIAVGENTGRLDNMMINLATFFEGEVDAQLKGLSSLIEPIIILILGIGVGFLVFAVIIPIYNISQIT